MNTDKAQIRVHPCASVVKKNPSPAITDPLPTGVAASAQDGGAGVWSGLRAGLAAESCLAAKPALAEPWEVGGDGVSGGEGRGARPRQNVRAISSRPRHHWPTLLHGRHRCTAYSWPARVPSGTPLSHCPLEHPAPPLVPCPPHPGSNSVRKKHPAVKNSQYSQHSQWNICPRPPKYAKTLA